MSTSAPDEHFVIPVLIQVSQIFPDSHFLIVKHSDARLVMMVRPGFDSTY